MLGSHAFLAQSNNWGLHTQTHTLNFCPQPSSWYSLLTPLGAPAGAKHPEWHIVDSALFIQDLKADCSKLIMLFCSPWSQLSEFMLSSWNMLVHYITDPSVTHSHWCSLICVEISFAQFGSHKDQPGFAFEGLIFWKMNSETNKHIIYTH